MTRKIGILLLIAMMLFSAGFDVIIDVDESENTVPEIEEVTNAE